MPPLAIDLFQMLCVIANIGMASILYVCYEKIRQGKLLPAIIILNLAGAAFNLAVLAWRHWR